ncbi:MAG: hypothetical protein RDU20_02685 [Desulfomonilaceae bacterium]|nr:hypothetical protein [Desulfomonilaceae bacterium]
MPRSLIYGNPKIRIEKEYIMADVQRPPVAGKGPAFMKETLAVFKDIAGNLDAFPDSSANKIKSTLEAKAQDVEPLLSRAYMKTVKAGETSYDCKVLAEGLYQCVQAGNEADALDNLGKLETHLDGLIHKVKTFVVRMT